MKFLNLRFVNRILYGRWHTDDSFKYTFISYSFSIIHLFLLCFFYAYEIRPLIIYGVFSVCLYLYCGISITKKKYYMYVLFIAVTEVLLHSILCCYYIGWEYGFMLYALAMIPVLFYLFTTTPNLKHPNTYAICCIIAIVTCFILTKFWASTIEPKYVLDISPLGINAIYCINCGIAFSMQSIFSALYTIEIQHFKEDVEHEKFVLDTIASKDPLTGLLNRRAMEPHLKNSKLVAEKKGTLFSLILCDIDNFKRINDIHGHALGDQVLMDIAKLFTTNLKSTDYVCRWGGEEFLILIPENEDTAVKIAERLRKKVEKLPITRDGTTISVTMTFGVSQYIPGFRIETIIKQADDNMYLGKNNGKNQVVCS